MPRDGNGYYTLPTGNPVASGTTIESSWANALTSDLAVEMTDSLSRSGKGGFTAPVGFVDFSGSIPGINFINEPTSGLKRFAAGDLRIQVQGTEAFRFTNTTQYALSGGSLKEVVVEESGVKIFRGEGGTTTCYFYNASVPAGWTPANPDVSVRSLMVGGPGGTFAGSQDPSGFAASVGTTVTVNLPADTGGHSLTVAEMPPHTHSVPSGGLSSGWSTGYRSEANERNNTAQTTGSSGSGNTHTHPLGGTAAGTGTGATSTINLRYAMGILGTL